MSVSDESVKAEVEAIKPPRRLQRRPIQMKRWIVEQTLVPGASVAKVAQRHGVNANQVFGWRKQYREGRLVDEKGAPKQASCRHDPAIPLRQGFGGQARAGQGLIHVGVIDQDGGLRSPPLGAGEGVASESSCPSHLPPVVKESPGPENGQAASVGRIEIELPNRVKVRVDADIDEAALRRVLAVAGAMA
jgi:hypothetical protein